MTNYFCANIYERIYVFVLLPDILFSPNSDFLDKCVTKFHENPSSGAEFVHADGQTWRSHQALFATVRTRRKTDTVNHVIVKWNVVAKRI